MKTMICSHSVIDETLKILRLAGDKNNEGVVLWLGSPTKNGERVVTECYEPSHLAAVDYFEIPAQGMRELMRHLRSKRLALLAQVHTHPGRAYHSEADNRWAIVRYEGALSFVIPRFARGVSRENFLEHTVVYQLQQDDVWLERDIRGELEIRHD